MIFSIINQKQIKVQIIFFISQPIINDFNLLKSEALRNPYLKIYEIYNFIKKDDLKTSKISLSSKSTIIIYKKLSKILVLDYNELIRKGTINIIKFLSDLKINDKIPSFCSNPLKTMTV